jgi:3-hydroxyisobutyrate dehydrogenase
MSENLHSNALNSITPIGFVGLGVMGSAMARHLLQKHGHVFAYNRTPSKAVAWHSVNTQATMCDDVTQLARQVDIVALCVGNDADVRQTLNAMLPHMRPGAMILDHTTTSSTLAQEMSRLSQTFGVTFLDCPVSGGQAGAENGTLTVMVGGDASAFQTAQPVMACYSKHQQYFGQSGTGQGAKMVNQVLIANILQGLSEGITLAKKMGLNVADVVNTLQHGAAASWQLQHRGITMGRGEFDFGFAIDLMLKDLGIVFDCSEQLNTDLPATREIRARYMALAQAGFGHEDTSALIRQYELV